ncbi:acetyl-CoA synthetase-like protein [Apiospora phragmitis]|uniref:Acetyl-CoA synthetase-like protein n=1 Tax=Apiospora phragmitis TaxID=2905665 RepID=A0ABR1T8K6_9PEZI
MLATMKVSHGSSQQKMEQFPPQQTPTCLQGVLMNEARFLSSSNILFYPMGASASAPIAVPYGALYDEARQKGVILASLVDFEEGMPVLLYLDDHWDTILWFWAVLYAGGIPTLSPPLSNVEEHRHKHIQSLSRILQERPYLRLHTTESLASYPPTKLASHRVPTPDPGSLAVLIFTSGSTGNAKAVRLTHRQILAAVAGKVSVRRLPEQGAFLNWIGLDHVASLIEIHIQALWLGVNQVHVHAADVVTSPRLFLQLLTRHRVTRSFAPKFFLAKLGTTCSGDSNDNPVANQEKYDLSNLTVLASGGEANDVSTCTAASELFVRHGAPRNVITTGFGMTETCAGAIFNTACPDCDVAAGRSIASLGRCMPGIEMRLARGTGDLELPGPVVFDGYYRDPAATADAFTPDGWIRTGDRASIDSEGNLILAGRLKDVVNIHGVKIPTADLQASLEMKLKDTQVARQANKVTVSYIHKEKLPLVEDLVHIDKLTTEACVMVNMACQPITFYVEQKSLPRIPTTTLGKISGAKMRAMFEAGVFDHDVTSHTFVVSDFKKKQRKLFESDMTVTESALRSEFAEAMGVESSESIGLDIPLFELGFTSMDLIRLKVIIDRRLHITVDTVLLLKHPTVRSMAGALDALIRKRAITQNGHANGVPAGDALYDPVVNPVTKGSKTPLWLIHPGIGEVLVFVGLAKQMDGDDRPIYALRARGLEPGQSTFATVTEAVDTYLGAIRQRQPRGPYAIAGYSYGAMIAFEMAKRLQTEDGEGAVQFLGTLNLPPHIRDRMRQLEWNMCLLHLAQFLGLVTEPYADEQVLTPNQSVYRHASRDDALETILDVAGPSRLQELGLGRRELIRWANVAYALPVIALEYEPSGCVQTLDVFHAEPLKVVGVTRQQWVIERLGRWRDFCAKEPRFYEVGGGHYTMIGSDYVVDFAQQLREAMAARGV